MADLSILMRSFKRQRLAQKQRQRFEEESSQNCNGNSNAEGRHENRDFGIDKCCPLTLHHGQNCPDNNSISNRKDCPTASISSSSKFFHETSLAAHDVRSKLMQSLANSDDDDDDDLPVRAAMLLAERRQREIESSQHRKNNSLASTALGNSWYMKRGPSHQERDMEEEEVEEGHRHSKERRRERSDTIESDHTTETNIKKSTEISHGCHKSATKKLPLSNNDDSDGSEDLLELYTRQLNKRKKHEQPENINDDTSDGKPLSKESCHSAVEEDDAASRNRPKSSLSKKIYCRSSNDFSNSGDEEGGQPSLLQSSLMSAIKRNIVACHEQDHLSAIHRVTEGGDDDLWDDNIDEDMIPNGNSEEKTLNKACRAKETYRSESQPKVIKDRDKYPAMRKKQVRTKSQGLADNLGNNNLDISEMDKNELEQLYPEIENPRLGLSGPLIPLQLIDPEKAEVIYSVPASINRYLSEYQRQGVQFLYSRLSKGMGAILGDDMGMGKTIQTISLLAALLRKTGTEKDRRDIYLRKKQFEELNFQRRQYAMDRAIMEVNMYPQSLSSENVVSWTPVLIVCPASVIENWVNELNFWGYFDLEVWDRKTADDVYEKLISGQSEILVCSKALLSVPEHVERLVMVPFKLVIVDEYHEYKSKKTKSRESLISIKLESSCQIIGLTGTPMQNDYIELFHLVDLCQPNLLLSLKEFKSYYMQPLKLSRTKDAKQDVIELGQKRQEELIHALKGVILKRSKESYLKDCLKNKDERVIFCELSEVQKEIYRHILTLPDYFLLSTSSMPCDCGINKDFFSKYKQMEAQGRAAQIDYYRRNKHEITPRKKCCYQAPWHHGEAPDIHPSAVLWRNQHKSCELCENCPHCILLPALHKLYKLSSHPILLQIEKYPEDCDDPKEQEKVKAKLEFAKVALTPSILEMLPGRSLCRKDSVMSNHQFLSGKMRYLDLCLSMFKVNDRVLIFSYSTTTLTLIEQYVKGKGYSYLRLDGSTPTKQRQTLVDKFQNDNTIFLFLISTKAGGLGLNLTAANKVIIYDVSWNPASDSQAQDRSYRIGQRNDVDVIRLVSQGTIEELIYARQIYKLHLKQQIEEDYADAKPARIFRGVQNDSTRKGELFGLENLLKFKDGSFIADLWTATSKKCPSIKTGRNEPLIHNVNEISTALCGMSEEEVENLGGSDDCFIPLTHPADDADRNEDSIFPEIKNTLDAAVRHSAFMREDEGRAVLNYGENGFDGEVGQESQLAALACDVLCQDNSDCEETIRPEEVPSAHDLNCKHLKTSSANPQAEDYCMNATLLGSTLFLKVGASGEKHPKTTESFSRNTFAPPLKDEAENATDSVNSSLSKPNQHIDRGILMGRAVAKDKVHKTPRGIHIANYGKKHTRSGERERAAGRSNIPCQI